MSELFVRKATKNELYFCVFCFGNKLFTNKIECESHLREKHFIDSKTEERNGINLWIERHLKYQELLSKSMSESIKTIPDRSKTLYRGCLMCDIIMKVYDIRDETYSRGTTHEIKIRDINIHYSGNNFNHINPHLCYYPFECLKCEEENEKCRKSGDVSDIKDRVKTAVKSMMRIHVKDKHFKDSTLDKDILEEQINKSIRTLIVTELEKINSFRKIIKNPQNSDEKMTFKKLISMSGPMRETKLVSFLSTKHSKPNVSVHLNKTFDFKNSEQTDPKVNPITNIEQRCELLNNLRSATNSFEKIQKRKFLLKNIKQAKEVEHKLKSALKCNLVDEKEKRRKRVSFGGYLKSKKMKEREDEDKYNYYRNKSIIENDSEDDQLFIDLSQESDPSISDSADSYDEKHDNYSDDLEKYSDLSEKSTKLSEKTNDDSSYCSDQLKGDPNRVIEITIDSGDEDKCEVIEPQITQKQDIEEKIGNSSTLSLEDNTCPQTVIKEETIDNNIIESNEQTIYTKLASNEVERVGKNYCVLCPAIVENSESLVDHYLSHCGVYLECAKCNQKFSSPQSFRGHNSEHSDPKNMLNLESFLDAKKWCEHYIEYIGKHDDIVKQVIGVNKLFCPVCHKMNQLFGIYGNNNKAEDMRKLSLDEDYIINHLHKHLQYFPYECIDCKFEDKKTAFCLDRNAIQHILEEHDVKNAFRLKTDELNRYFDRRKSITKLDNIITNCLNLSIEMKSFRDKFAFMANKKTII